MLIDVEIPPLHEASGDNLHPLQGTWAFWCKENVGDGKWMSGFTCLARFNTVEAFWEIYNHMNRFDGTSHPVDFMLFRDGIEPTWEDPANRDGGRWMLRNKKGNFPLLWEELTFALIGEVFEDAADITGAFLSVRNTGHCSIGIWNKSGSDTELTNRIYKDIISTWQFPDFLTIVYARHSEKKSTAKAFSAANGSDSPVTPATPALPPPSSNVSSGREYSTQSRDGLREHSVTSVHRQPSAPIPHYSNRSIHQGEGNLPRNQSWNSYQPTAPLPTTAPPPLPAGPPPPTPPVPPEPVGVPPYPRPHQSNWNKTQRPQNYKRNGPVQAPLPPEDKPSQPDADDDDDGGGWTIVG